MIAAITYREICQKLFKRPEVKMVGLLFARPNSQLVDEEIIPNIEYFHNRAGRHIHFFCSGYQHYSDAKRPKVFQIESTNWYFDVPKFISLFREIDRRIGWKYSGGADLIICNTRFNDKGATLDFDAHYVFNLNRMKRDGVIDKVEEFFELIFLFAESYSGNNAVIDFIYPPDIGNFKNVPMNLVVLWNRANFFWQSGDYAGVLHSCASIFETMGKHIINNPNVKDHSLGSFFEGYRKKSSLSSTELDYIKYVYELRNKVPLAGHGSLDSPQIRIKNAREIMKTTSAFVRKEYTNFS